MDTKGGEYGREKADRGSVAAVVWEDAVFPHPVVAFCTGGISCFPPVVGIRGTLSLIQEVTMQEEKLRQVRPGRKLGAEKRRIAREILREFYASEEFSRLGRKVQLAMQELCPAEESGKLELLLCGQDTRRLA